MNKALIPVMVTNPLEYAAYKRQLMATGKPEGAIMCELGLARCRTQGRRPVEMLPPLRTNEKIWEGIRNDNPHASFALVMANAIRILVLAREILSEFPKISAHEADYLAEVALTPFPLQATWDSLIQLKLSIHHEITRRAHAKRLAGMSRIRARQRRAK